MIREEKQNMISNKIGLVTLYKNNYGSALQCFSLKTVLENQGFDCYLLQEIKKTSYTSKLCNKITILMRSFFYPGYFKEFLSMRNAMKIEQSYMTQNSHELLNDFIKHRLTPNENTWKDLIKLGKNDEYKAFVVGSDQVWNASRVVSPFFFLKFAPKKKRHTYAVSFGVSKVPKWNKSCIKEGIKGFQRVSVRENIGKKIVMEYANIKVEQCIDPTMLLSSAQWRKFSEHVKTDEKPYIFVHFLNEPNDLAINKIKMLAFEKKYRVYGFGYWYDKYKTINDFRFIDGGPEEYIAMIDHAKYAMTDSFHTTIFSINLHTEFNVFHRQYLHHSPQSSRIFELLDKFNLQDRLVTSLDCEMKQLDFDEIDQVIRKERQNSMKFLEQELSYD